MVLSKTSIDRGWVKEAVDAAHNERANHKEFRIIPIRIDDCPIPKFLETTRWIDMSGGKLDLRSAVDLLLSLDYENTEIEIGNAQDVYTSLSWREGESEVALPICGLLSKAGFRLIGDSK